MRPSHWAAALCLAALTLAACGQSAAPAPTSAPTESAAQPAADAAADRTDEASAFIELLAQGQFEAAHGQFDSKMGAALSADKLRETWAMLTSDLQAGAYGRQLTPRASQADGYTTVVVPCEFAKATIDVEISFDGAGKIAGLFFRPAATPGAEAPAHQWPEYADPAAFSERGLAVGAGQWVLSGTLALPAGPGPFPAVVLVHGSGPHDRDETIGPNKPFRDLAGGLASRGVAVLRYDKRTLTHGAQIAGLPSFTLDDETVDDAVAAAAALRALPEIDPARIIVVGHSLGGYALPRIGAADPALGGLVALAGPSRPLEALLAEQYAYLTQLDGSVSADEQKLLDELDAQIARAQAADLAADTPAAELPLGIPAPYWLDLRPYRPAEQAAGLAQPMLFMQGGRDYQVTLEDLEGWRRALGGQGRAAFKTYPQLNHLFMAGAGAKAAPAEYEQPGHVDRQVIEDLAAWVKQR